MSGRPVEPVEIPPACPFVAFEDDRERRSTAPDHRHRCYAEPRPAPRALAHQERFCLTRDFPSCPTFQAWARREAARDADPASPREVAAGRPPADPAAWLGAAVAGAAGGSGRPSRASREDAGQLGAFDDLGGHPDDAPGETAGDPGGHAELAALVGGTAVGATAPLGAPGGSAPTATDAAADAPPFLAGRASGTRTGVGAGRPRGAPPRPLEGGNPPWERPRRAEFYPSLRTRTGLPAVPPVALALIALAIAAVGLFILPSLMGDTGGAPPASTPPAAASTAAATSLAPTAATGPTPQVYTVRAGDLMSTIATRFHVTLAALEAANPQIKDPNKIAVGDQITIPTPGASASASGGP